jgi:hypothetical protein
MATIHPVVDEGLGNSAYVVELGDRRALVLDPARDPTRRRRPGPRAPWPAPTWPARS